MPSCYDKLINERASQVVPKNISYKKPKEAQKPPWMPKKIKDEEAWSPRAIEKSAVDK